MEWADRIVLLKHRTRGVDGDSVDEFPERREVWANRVGVGYREFYAAAAANVALEVSYEVHPEEYDGERYFEFKGQLYFVPRPYQKGDGVWVLTASTASVNKGSVSL